jgi:Beta-lactamase superfamily domain
MQLEWYGQSAVRLSEGPVTVFIDPFDDLSALAARGLRWDYPPITGVSADLVLVTHEHRDHNGVDAVGGDPAIVRAAAGTHESPVGPVIGIASEHDDVAGTQRGHNTLYAFSLGGLRVAHLGDLGQAALRPEQLDALGRIDLLLIPVGGVRRSAPSRRARSSTRSTPASSSPITTGRSASTSSSRSRTSRRASSTSTRHPRRWSSSTTCPATPIRSWSSRLLRELGAHDARPLSPWVGGTRAFRSGVRGGASRGLVGDGSGGVGSPGEPGRGEGNKSRP